MATFFVSYTTSRDTIEADADGAVVSEVARRHDITRQHIYQWRREFRRRLAAAADHPTFVAVEIRSETCSEERDLPMPCRSGEVEGVVELVLRNDRRIRILGRINDDLLVRLIRIGEAA